VIAGTAAKPLALPLRTEREVQMPLLFYFPLIIWMGMVEIMQDELRVPAKAKVGTPARL
jgi:hypothetical protein